MTKTNGVTSKILIPALANLTLMPITAYGGPTMEETLICQMSSNHLFDQPPKRISRDSSFS